MEQLSFTIPYTRDACSSATREAVFGTLWLAGQTPCPAHSLTEWNQRCSDLACHPAGRRSLMRCTDIRRCMQLAASLQALDRGLEDLFVRRQRVVYVCVLLGPSTRKPRLALLIDLSCGLHPLPRASISSSDPPAEGISDILCRGLELESVAPPLPPEKLDAVRRKTLRHLVTNADALLHFCGPIGFDVPIASSTPSVESAVATDQGPQAPVDPPRHGPASTIPPTRVHIYALVEEPDAAPPGEAAYSSDTDSSSLCVLGDADTRDPMPPACFPSRQPHFQHKPGFVLPVSRRSVHPSSRRSGAPRSSGWPNPTLHVVWGHDRPGPRPSAPEQTGPLRQAPPHTHSPSVTHPAKRLVWLAWTGRVHGWNGALPPLPS